MTKEKKIIVIVVVVGIFIVLGLVRHFVLPSSNTILKPPTTHAPEQTLTAPISPQPTQGPEQKRVFIFNDKPVEAGHDTRPVVPDEFNKY